MNSNCCKVVVRTLIFIGTSVFVLLRSRMVVPTKADFLELASETLQSRKTGEFMKEVFSHAGTLTDYLNMDVAFKKNFQTLAVRIGSSSSMLFNFLASLKIIPEHRPPSFATIINSLFVMVSEKKEQQLLIPLLIKVILCFYLCLVPGCFALEVDYTIETTENHLMLSTPTKTVEFEEYTEIFPMNPIFDQISLLSEALLKIRGFMTFSRNNEQCSDIGNQNTNTDSLENIMNIARQRNLTNIKFQHKEVSKQQLFDAFLRYSNNTFSCVLSSSFHSIQFMLAQNTFRDKPTSPGRINQLRKKMLSLFRDENNRKCVRHGMFPERFYTSVFRLDSPELEHCSLSCFLQHRNHIVIKGQQLVTVFPNQTLGPDCQAWTYNLATKTCMLVEEINARDFLEEISFDKIENKVAYSGLSNCMVNNFFKAVPKIFVNNKLSDMRDFCSFSKKNLVFSSFNIRCKNLYYSLNKPIQSAKKDLEVFVTNYKRDNFLSRRNTRSVGMATSKIIQSLAKAALRSGVSKLQKDTLGMLKDFCDKIRSNGYKNAIIAQKNHSFHKVDLNQYLSASQQLQQNIELTFIEQNYNNFLDQLEESAVNVKVYLSKLMHDKWPLENKTFDFIANRSYIFSSFLDDNNNIVRQFIIQRPGPYQATMVSLVPLGNFFFTSSLWQSDKFFGSLLEGINQCILLLIQNDYNTETVNLCSSQVSAGNFRKLQATNIYFMGHQFYNVSGKIVVFNTKGLIEISCRQNRLMQSILGLSIFVASDDCNILFNGNIVFKALKSSMGFSPELIYSLNYTLSNDHLVPMHQTTNSFIMGCGFIVFIVLFLCSCVRRNGGKLPLAPHLLEEREMIEFNNE